MAIRITAFKDEHLQGLDSLWRQCLADDPLWEATAISASVGRVSRSALLLVATVGAEVIGSITAGYDGHRGWLHALAVLPTYRFDQVATNLVIEAERQLTAIGCTKINLQIRAANAHAQKFYRTLGYAAEDRVSMGKRLDSLPGR